MNLFHCCVQKTASQWIRKILSEPEIKERTGLELYFDDNAQAEDSGVMLSPQQDRVKPFPKNVIVSPLYSDFESFQKISKIDDYKVFFVMRDPRDLIISWYFSVKYSHPLINKISEIRNHLNDFSLEEGLIYSIDLLNQSGLFDSLRSWKDAPEKDSRIALFKFEELTKIDNHETFKRLFEHCSIELDKASVQEILRRNSFRSLTRREIGIEDKNAHLRKGIAGDWINYFTDDIDAKFKEVTGDLVEFIGYENDKLVYVANKVTALELQLRRIFQGDFSSSDSVLQVYNALSENANLRHKLGVLSRDVKHLSEENCMLKNQRKRQQEKARRKNQKMGGKIKKLQEKMKGMRADAKGDRRKLRKIDRERQGLKAEINEIKSGRFWRLKEKLLCWKRM